VTQRRMRSVGVPFSFLQQRELRDDMQQQYSSRNQSVVFFNGSVNGFFAREPAHYCTFSGVFTLHGAAEMNVLSGQIASRTKAETQANQTNLCQNKI